MRLTRRRLLVTAGAAVRVRRRGARGPPGLRRHRLRRRGHAPARDRHQHGPLRPVRLRRSRDAGRRGVRARGQSPLGPDVSIDRRTFLKGAAAGAAAGTAAGLLPTAPRPPRPSRDYEVPGSLPVDKVVRTTCSPNCTGSCGQLAFVRDGVVVKVQQAADYPDTAYNPRGCMKGLSYLNQIYGDDRIMTPLIRTGERGSRRVPRRPPGRRSLDRIATGLSDIGTKYGWDSIHVFGQVPGLRVRPEGRQLPGLRAPRACPTAPASTSTATCRWACRSRSASRTRSTRRRTGPTAGSCCWSGSNPVETRIPDVHFIFDAVEQGAKLVVIDPVVLPHRRQGRRAPAHQARHRRRAGPRDVPPGHRGRRPGTRRSWPRTRTRRCSCARTPACACGRRTSSRAARPTGSQPGTPRRAGPRSSARTAWASPMACSPALEGRWTVTLADGTTSPRSRPGSRSSARSSTAGRPRRPREVTGLDADLIVKVARGLRRRQARGHPHGRRLQPLVPRRPHRAGVRAARGADGQHRQLRRRVLASTSASTRSAWTPRPGGAPAGRRRTSCRRSTSSAAGPRRCTRTCPTRSRAGTASSARSPTCSSSRWT